MLKSLAIVGLLLCSVAQANHYPQQNCRCEDRDHDGYFGLVRYNQNGPFPGRGERILVGDYGSYYDCQNLARYYRSCATYVHAVYACEDRDHNGYFGVVQYDQYNYQGRIIAANYGNKYQCAQYAASL